MQVDVVPVNDDPVAGNDAAPQAVLQSTSLSVDAAHGVLANDSDIDGGTLSVSDVNGNAPSGGFITVVGTHGTLVLNAATGAYTYTSADASASDFGTDTFTYTVSDGAGGTDTATLAIEVTEQGLRTLDADLLDGSGNIFVGTGNTGQNYNVSANHGAGLEIGLKIHYRQGVDILPSEQAADGTAVYLVPLGTQVSDPAHSVINPAANRAAWSFDFSVNTDTSGTSGKTLADYNFTITISDGEGNTQIYDLVHGGPATTPWQLRGAPAFTGFSDDDGAVHTTLSQNSVNIGFAFLQAAFGNNLAGKHFDIQMTATDAVTGALMASTHDQLVVDTPPVATANVASVTEDVDSNGAAAGTDTFTTGNVLTDGVPDSDVNGNPITVTAVNGLAANVGTGLVGTYGTLNFNSNGTYTYTLNNANAAVQALGVGETLSEQFSYTANDGVTPNASSTATLTLTINGSNDSVVSPPTMTAEVTEDLVTLSNGNVLLDVTDTDIHDTHSVTAVNGSALNVGTAVAGLYGTLFIAANGDATYTLDNDLVAVQALNTGSTPLQDSFTYTVSDGNSTATTTLTVNVNGTNDAPIANDDFATATEDVAGTTPSVFNVLANDTDVDAADSKTVTSFSYAGQTNAAGSVITAASGAVLNVASDGTVTFSQNGAFNGLAQGAINAQFFSYTMQDGASSASTASGQINVSGVNDAPVANTDNVTIIEDTPTLINLVGNDTDADGPGSALAINSIDGTLITFSGQTVPVAGGTVTVTANPVTLVLNRVSFAPTADSTAASSFQYTIKDGLGAISNIGTVNVSITPVNDAPVNAGPASVTATEDAAFLFNGGNAMSVTDVDGNVTVTLSVDHGVLNVTAGPGSAATAATADVASATPGR